MSEIRHTAGCGEIVLYKGDLESTNILASEDYLDHEKKPWKPYSIVICYNCKKPFSLHYEITQALEKK